VLLLDLKLPDLDGAEVLKAIRDRRPESLKSVLVLTGDTTSDRAEEVKRLGADALVPKPIDFGALLSQMSRLPDDNGAPAPTQPLNAEP
jgi:DNA-binding response OmpR family regulator